MGSEIGDRRCAHHPFEAPVERNVRIQELVGEPDGPPEQHLADASFVDELLHQRERGQPPVVEADRVRNACVDRRFRRGFGRCVVGGQWLLAQQGHSRRGGGLDDLGMCSRRRADVDDVDIRPRHDLAPVRRPLFDSVPAGGTRDSPFVASAHDEQPRRAGKLAHARRDRVAVRMRPAHQPVADDSDADLGLGAHPRATAESD